MDCLIADEIKKTREPANTFAYFPRDNDAEYQPLKTDGIQHDSNADRRSLPPTLPTFSVLFSRDNVCVALYSCRAASFKLKISRCIWFIVLKATTTKRSHAIDLFSIHLTKAHYSTLAKRKREMEQIFNNECTCFNARFAQNENPSMRNENKTT